MPMPQAMELVSSLLTQAQALAAVAARLQLEGEGAGDAELKARLERVIDALGAGEALADLAPRERAVVAAFARSYLKQALELVEDPARDGGWSHTDPLLLQAQGRASEAVAGLISEAGLGRPGARILDVGTGVARLAIALAETFPGSTVVGLDPWEPALELARANVAEAGMEGRISLLPVPVQAFTDAEGFDLTWFPAFFIPEAVVDEALAAVRRATRPGGVVVVGTFEAPDDALAGAVDEMITVRSGGTPLTPAAAVERLRRAGFSEARPVEKTWKAPLDLVLGR